ncbi:MAG: sigma-70 family RNA polymerase sigma factor [Coleofasciculaceae cyanobacterium SM2_3_26]|nr:sigma-70 family RNA polymerase sigma factor [Coleofasciculaceae cyanobacterium SM2_3_26]
MLTPAFPERHHPLVKSLFHRSDRELLTSIQRHPDEGRYFVTLFCRYSAIVYNLIHHGMKSPVQADYLFALTWRHIYHELMGLDLHAEAHNGGNFNLQNWLINITAVCINQAQLPPPEDIHYSIEAVSPPLWCYLQLVLDRLPPKQRLVVVLSETFHWGETRIAAYMQAEGEVISPTEVRAELSEGYRRLEAELPEDIRAIYLQDAAPEQAVAG